MTKKPPPQAPTRNQVRTWLVHGARQMGLALSERQIEQFLIYLNLLIQWSAKINLTTTLTHQSIVDLHFCDSLALWSMTSPSSGNRLLDVGAGAGFPGVPLKILEPAIQLTLLEPRRKRAAFLQVVISMLDLPSTTVEVSRLSDLHVIRPYQWIVARGIGNIGSLVEQARPLLTPDGILALYLSHRQNIETTGKPYHVRIHKYRLPFSAIDRQLAIISFN